MRILVKSIPENFEKEKSGVKPCTVRRLDGKDVIEIINTETNELVERTITDISVWDGRIIISFKAETRGD
jgi:hypothetical protein